LKFFHVHARERPALVGGQGGEIRTRHYQHSVHDRLSRLSAFGA
jgi:hypothetical protein